MICQQGECGCLWVTVQRAFSSAPMQTTARRFACINNNMPIVSVKPAGERAPFHSAGHRWRKFRLGEETAALIVVLGWSWVPLFLHVRADRMFSSASRESMCGFKQVDGNAALMTKRRTRWFHRCALLVHTMKAMKRYFSRLTKQAPTCPIENRPTPCRSSSPSSPSALAPQVRSFWNQLSPLALLYLRFFHHFHNLTLWMRAASDLSAGCYLSIKSRPHPRAVMLWLAGGHTPDPQRLQPKKQEGNKEI